MTMFTKAVMLFLIVASCSAQDGEGKSDKTIKQVVKLLQGMLKKSVEEGDEERKVFAKFQCYCNTAESEKEKSIKGLSSQIEGLDSDVAGRRGVIGVLTSEIADLTEKMDENKKAVDEYNQFRSDSHDDYEKTMNELKIAIHQMEDAIDTLAEVGADQASRRTVSADNKQFMANFGEKKACSDDSDWKNDDGQGCFDFATKKGKYKRDGHEDEFNNLFCTGDVKKQCRRTCNTCQAASLLSVQSQVKEALRAASGLMNGKNLKTVTGFLQAPFTGTYTSQSAQVVGILKDMKATFEANAEDAWATEQRSREAHKKYLETMKEAYDEMDEAKDKRETALGNNERDLKTERSSLSKSRTQLGEDSDFLAKLKPNCKEKAESYAERNLQRANEEAAIAEAVSILNSDDAFATFGGTDAAKGANKPPELEFIQLRSAHRHMAGNMEARSTAQAALQKALKSKQSARLAKVLDSLQAKNPFEAVLKEIDNMIQVIYDEQDEDEEKIKWCRLETRSKIANLNKKEKQIEMHEDSIAKFKKLIEGPTKGLNKLIEETETSLLQNKEGQSKQTQLRKEQNANYKKDVRNLAEAQRILGKAIKVLKTYYVAFEKKYEADLGQSFLQAPPRKEGGGRYSGGDYSEGEYKGDKYEGQSSQGTDVIDLMDFIQEQTGKEKTDATAEEKSFQEKYDKFMETSTKKQRADEKLLAGYQEDLADTQKDLLDEREDMEDTTNDQEAIENYLHKIDPGCSWIDRHFSDRRDNRRYERRALEHVWDTIYDSPANKELRWGERKDELGHCKEVCLNKGEFDFELMYSVECEACEAGVTVPAYCAGHNPGAKGCPDNPRAAKKEEEAKE